MNESTFVIIKVMEMKTWETLIYLRVFMAKSNWSTIVLT